MAVLATALIAERWNDEVIIRGTGGTAQANIADYLPVPAGLGDVAIMEVLFEATTIGTAIADAIVLAQGVRLSVVINTGPVDLIGVEPIRKITTATSVAAYFSPDPLVLWRQGEFIEIIGPDMDTGATGIYTIVVKAVRVRPVEGPANPDNLQLVR